MDAGRTALFLGLVMICFSPVVFGQGGIHFIENKNQWQDGVDFSARVAGGNLSVQANQWRLSFIDLDKVQERHQRGHLNFRESEIPGEADDCIDAVSIGLSFMGGNARAKAAPFGMIPTTFNYFIGNDPKKWASNAHGYAGVVYQNLYPGIDLKIYSDGDYLKYDFLLAPGANPDTIAIAYSGADGIAIDNGNVTIHSDLMTLIEQHPLAFQWISGVKKIVTCNYILTGDRIRFDFPDGYDACFPLVIDPLLIFSTYSGSTADNWGSSATPGEYGNLYSTGVTAAFEFRDNNGVFPATPGVFQTNYGGLFDVGILKYDSSGQHLLYASYLGGNDSESPHSLVMNLQQELLVLGTTSSSNFPTTAGAFDRTYNGGSFTENVIDYDFGSDIFVAKISKDGSQLLGSTFLGGSGNDGLNPSGTELVVNYGDQLRGDIVTDVQGNTFVSTVTSSPDFPVTENSFGTAYKGGSTDALIMELNPSLTQLVWATFLGGNGSDASHTIKLDHLGNLFVAGGTRSSNFPTTTGSYQPANAGYVDGWIANIKGDGSAIISATLTGTSSFDQIYFLDLNKQEEVYVYGQTSGDFLVTPGVYNNPHSGQFIQKFDNDLKHLAFSTVFGSQRGVPDISPTAFLVNDCNNLFMTGWGGELNSSLGYWNSDTRGMPVRKYAFQPRTSGNDFYFMVLTADAKEFLYGTYMGGSNSLTHVDGGTSRFDKRGIVYHAVCAGCQYRNSAHGPTSDFPTTPNAYSRVNRSRNCNNAAFKFDLSSLRALIQTNNIALDLPGYFKVCYPDKIVFQNKSVGGESFEWNFGDGTGQAKSDTAMIIHQYAQPGIYTIKLKAFDKRTCTGKDSTSTTVQVWPRTGIAGGDQVICHGSSAQLTASGGILYEWRSEDGSFATQQAQPLVSPEDSTRYFVSVTDNEGCVTKDTIAVGVIPGIDLQFDFLKIYDCFSRPTLKVKNKTDPGQEVFFDFGDGKTSDQTEDTHQFENDGTYTVRLVGKKDFCVYDKSKELPFFEIKVPNVITPGLTPGENDTFVIQYGDRPISETDVHVSLRIYNRWGGKVYESGDYDNSWAGENVLPGVYYYEAVIEGETTCKGWVQVIR